MADQRTVTVDAAGPREPPALAVHAVSMRYGETLALRGIDLVVEPGSIHALVGENGAGKSTLLSIVSGRVRPSAGSVVVYGRPLHGGSPRAARSLGVAAIYQELTLVPTMTARENVFLGSEKTAHRVLRSRAMDARYRELADQLGVSIRADALVDTLSVADQQAVEIMRALQADARLLLLDEPTSALAQSERERLFGAVRGLRGRGVSSLFVSHDLADVLSLADTVAVFRDGRIVANRPAHEWTRQGLVSAMLGGVEIAPALLQGSRAASATASDMIGVERLSLPRVLKDISFTVSPGEIVGLGGLVGSGRSAILRCLAGDVDGRASGSLIVGGFKRRLPRDTARANALGIGLIPEDRRARGLVMTMTALDNVMLPAMKGFALARYSRRAAHREATAAARRVGFDPGRLGTSAGNLSGGNQQKLLLARWIREKRLKLLLADEPTRGVDVGAKADILRTLRLLADEGLAMVVVSSDLEELEAIADRVIVLSQGEQVTELRRENAEITVERILSAAFQA